MECGKDASFEINILASTTTSEAWDILKGWFFATSPGDRSLSIYWPDKDVGSDHFSAEVKLQNWNATPESNNASPIEISMTVLPNGEVSHTTATT